MADLQGKKLAVLATNDFEDSELSSPVDAVKEAGGEAAIIAPEAGTITGKHGAEFDVDLTSAEAKASDFDALLLPGGTGNADALRLDEGAVAFVKEFAGSERPLAAICHGAWILTDADVVKGKTLTSFPSLQTDLRNAGATWVDEEVHVDGQLISSRTPKDLPVFNNALVEALS